MRPRSNTMIVSACLTVFNRCAIMIVVTLCFLLMFSMAFWTCSSFLESRALVASSRISRSGFRSTARARAILCFWPPDSIPPSDPTSVLMPWGIFITKS
mmetsp:Transcript_17086/g.19707  ORF Transcript_17086/g.19707 Transcript_17086/m.19707 type:complete len:99 (-) Transcript_17086:58-354(-)